MATTASSVTIDIVPEIDLTGFNADLRAAIARHLRELADELSPAPETEPTLWGFKVGDRVEYTEGSKAFLGEREVMRICKDHIKLLNPEDRGLGRVGNAWRPSEIRKVNP